MSSSLTPSGSSRRWRELRRRVLERDRGVCWLCGRAGADSVDHVLPRSMGGTDDERNLRAAHKRCNGRRGDRAPSAPENSRAW